MERPALRDVDLHEICPDVSPSYSRAISTAVSGTCSFRRSGRHELCHACQLWTLKASSPTGLSALHIKIEVSGFAQTRRGLAISLCPNAAASARPTKVQIFRCDRHSYDRRTGIVLGFCPYLNDSFEERHRRRLDRRVGLPGADGLAHRRVVQSDDGTLVSNGYPPATRSRFVSTSISDVSPQYLVTM
jgi:hypothetical protein